MKSKIPAYMLVYMFQNALSYFEATEISIMILIKVLTITNTA